MIVGNVQRRRFFATVFTLADDWHEPRLTSLISAVLQRPRSREKVEQRHIGEIEHEMSPQRPKWSARREGEAPERLQNRIIGIAILLGLTHWRHSDAQSAERSFDLQARRRVVDYRIVRANWRRRSREDDNARPDCCTRIQMRDILIDDADASGRAPREKLDRRLIFALKIFLSSRGDARQEWIASSSQDLGRATPIPR